MCNITRSEHRLLANKEFEGFEITIAFSFFSSTTTATQEWYHTPEAPQLPQVQPAGC
jgi:hypothetical protein